MSLAYTVGNWSVASHEVDTITTTKNVAVPDLDYAHDFSVVTDSSSEARLLNTSGTSLEPVEKLRYAREKVNDIYRTLETQPMAKLPVPSGIRVLAENTEILSASNTVSGQEVDVPIRVWTCIESSTNNCVTGQALLWALQRHIATLLPTGAVSANMLVSMFRGDLNPTI